MKKTLVLPFALLMIFSLAGCGNNKVDNPPSSSIPTPNESSSNVEGTASLTFERNDEGYTVTGETENVENIIIPSTYQDLPVTAIGNSAFAYSKHTAPILSVTIPDSVTKIGLNAFYNRSEMTTVTIGQNSSLKEIDRNAFSGNSALTSIYIPAGLTTLGDSAFNNDGSIDFTVDATNAFYYSENGHLIEKETKILIRGGQNPTIPESVLKIASAAFRKSHLSEINIPTSITTIENYIIADSSISVINYNGTKEQWNVIEKAKFWNYRKKDIEIRYTNNIK